MNAHPFHEGQGVLWLCTQSGGWNLSGWVKAEVVKVNRATVTIKAFKKDGSFVLRNVRPANLKTA